jgi:transcriptional regulator with XRE-family HTH domain
MKLADYLQSKGISQKDFADAAGISTGMVSLLVRGVGAAAGGDGKPVGVSHETMRRIIKASKGAITKRDFVLREAVYQWAE